MLGSQQSPVIDYFHILITLWTNDYLNEHLTRFIISMDEKVTGLNCFLMVSVIYSLRSAGLNTCTASASVLPLCARG